MWSEEPSHGREKFGTPVLSSAATLSVTWFPQLPPCCYSEWQYRGEVESEILAASNRKNSGWIKQKGIYRSNCRIRIRGCWNTWLGLDLLGPKVAKPPKPRQHTWYWWPNQQEAAVAPNNLPPIQLSLATFALGLTEKKNQPGWLSKVTAHRL